MTQRRWGFSRREIRSASCQFACFRQRNAGVSPSLERCPAARTQCCSLIFSLNGPRWVDVPSRAAQAWDSVRRVREPVAWVALVLTAFYVVVSGCQFFNLADATAPVPIPGPGGTGPALSAFALRASAMQTSGTTARILRTAPTLENVTRTHQGLMAIACGFGLFDVRSYGNLVAARLRSQVIPGVSALSQTA